MSTIVSKKYKCICCDDELEVVINTATGGLGFKSDLKFNRKHVIFMLGREDVQDLITTLLDNFTMPSIPETEMELTDRFLTWEQFNKKSAGLKYSDYIDYIAELIENHTMPRVEGRTLADMVAYQHALLQVLSDTTSEISDGQYEDPKIKILETLKGQLEELEACVLLQQLGFEIQKKGDSK